MYRRIEVIHEFPLFLPTGEPDEFRFMKTGIMVSSPGDAIDAWIDKLHGPRCAIPGNTRFYFTEKGWREVGRHVAAGYQRHGWQYRVIAIKENAIDVVFRDPYEVAGQPRRKWRRAGRRQGRA